MNLVVITLTVMTYESSIESLVNERLLVERLVVERLVVINL